MISTVWEDTLIIALRDLQWRKAIERHFACQDDKEPVEKISPGVLLKFDGNAESKVGDTLLSTPTNQFFLVEFKAGKGEVASEWNGKGKYLYHFLCALCELQHNVADLDVRAVGKQMIRTCLSAHRLAYWSSREEISPTMDAGIMITLPYLEGVRTSRKKEQPRTGIDLHGYIPSSNVEIAVNDLFSDDLSPKDYEDSDDGTVVSIAKGVDIYLMQAYIGWLAHKNNDDSVKIAMFDSGLNLIAISSKLSELLVPVNDLASLFQPAPAPSGRRSKRRGIDPFFEATAMQLAEAAHSDAAKVIAKHNPTE